MIKVYNDFNGCDQEVKSREEKLGLHTQPNIIFYYVYVDVNVDTNRAVNMKKEEILLSIQDLPPFPETVLKAIEAMKDPEISASKIVGIIQYDPTITASILRFANSAYLFRAQEESYLT